MVRLLALIALAGCGRIGFDVATQSSDGGDDDGRGDGVVAVGHDEDGDGVPDTTDVCPYVAGTQNDEDSDGVGDDCDPHPGVARDHLMMFSTLGPGDQPLTLDVGLGTWSQGPDAIVYDGDVTGNFGTTATMPLMVAADVRIALVVDILEVGNASTQHQLAVSTCTAIPNYFGELNEQLGSYSNAQITHFDGLNFVNADFRMLATGIHAGTIVFVLTQSIGTRTRLDVTWPGEPYGPEVDDAVYQGSQQLQININNLRLQIRSLTVITST